MIRVQIVFVIDTLFEIVVVVVVEVVVVVVSISVVGKYKATLGVYKKE